jgi:hypothetical protein
MMVTTRLNISSGPASLSGDVGEVPRPLSADHIITRGEGSFNVYEEG